MEFSAPEIAVVNDYLSSILIKMSDRITLPDIFKALKDKFPSHVENTFVPLLNKAIKDKKLHLKLKIVRGRYGGVRLDDAIERPSANSIKLIDVMVKSTFNKVDDNLPGQVKKELDRDEITRIAAEHEKKLAFMPLRPEPKAVAKAKPVDRNDLFINNKRWDVPHTKNEIKTLLINVLALQEEPDGPIEFLGQRYSCSESELKFLENFLFFFYGAGQVIE